MDLRARQSLDGVVLRLVEQQGSQATRRITDSLTEQAWLEAFLEQSKPELPDPEECPLRHRLLLTPFRYRKRHGSRFAARWERGLFYGSRSRYGCLLEGAYYELLFHVQISTPHGLRLHNQRSKALQDRLRDPQNPQFCQMVGRQMREAGIEAFDYHSARSREEVEVQMEATAETVAFRCLDDNSISQFSRDQYAVAGVLPQPSD